ncbi:MAG: hypothetical protein Kow0092_24470 [Deferrisomatales bacterium]
MKPLAAAALAGLVPLASTASTLEERVDALEKRSAEIYHTLEEKKGAGLMTRISERVAVSGLLEVEAGFERVSVDGGPDEDASDLVLATAQLGFDVRIAEPVGGTLIFLFEEDETEPIEVDEATVDYARDGWSARIGRQYVPFGVFPSHFVSDPLTLELGETRETALAVSYAANGFTVSGFLFNGDVEKAGDDDHLRDWGAALGWAPAPGLELGASLLSDLADSDAEVAGSSYGDRVPGWSAYGVAALGPVELLGEVLGAVESFDPADLDADGDGDGDRPFAWNVELAWGVAPTVELAARLEGSREFVDQPELQFGAVVSWSPWAGVSLSGEYLRGSFDKDFGGDQTRDLVTLQLAAEF